MTIAIAASAAARPASSAALAPANPAFAPIGAPGGFATALATQQAGPATVTANHAPAPGMAMPEPAKPGMILPVPVRAIAGPVTGSARVAPPHAPAKASRDDSAAVPIAPAATVALPEPTPPAPAPTATLASNDQNPPQSDPPVATTKSSVPDADPGATAQAQTIMVAMGAAPVPTTPPPPPPAAARKNPALAAHGAIVADPQIRMATLPLTRPGVAAAAPVAAPGHSPPRAGTAEARPAANDQTATAPSNTSQNAIPAMALPATLPTASPANPAEPAAANTAPGNFAALVDQIARARAETVATAVGVTLRHADFGPVSLQFNSRDAGLSVTMHSADPGFAPAAAAAATAGANDTGRPGNNNHADQSAPQARAQDAPPQSANAGMGSGARESPREQGAREQGPRANPRSPGPASSDAAEDAAIFA